MNANEKKCSKCKETKQSSEFYKDNSKKDGYRPDCKACSKKRNKERYKENKEWFVEKSKKYYRENIESCKNRSKNFYENNKIKILKSHKAYRQNNTEICKSRSKNYYKKHKQEILECSKKYRKSHEDYYTSYGKEWRKNNKGKSRQYMKKHLSKIENLLSSRVFNSLRKSIGFKRENKHWNEFLDRKSVV